LRQPNIRNKIDRALKIDELIKWSKEFVLPGCNGVSLYNIVIFIVEELKKDNLPTRANSVAFSFFLSIFPFIIFVLPLLSYTPLAETAIAQFEESMDGVFPSSAKQYLLGIVSDIRSEGSFGLQGTGFLLSIFFASSGMLTLMFGFDKSYDQSFKSRGYLKKRLIALVLTILFAAIVFTSLVLIVLGGQLLSYLANTFDLATSTSLLISLLKWIMIVLLFYSVITFIYRYGPSTYRPLRWINIGATLATLLSISFSVGFSYFINHFGRYNEIYGTVSALIVLLIWLQLNAFIVLAGFELNTSIIVNRDRLFRDDIKPIDRDSVS